LCRVKERTKNIAKVEINTACIFLAFRFSIEIALGRVIKGLSKFKPINKPIPQFPKISKLNG
jgi:hypothetical protein